MPLPFVRPRKVISRLAVDERAVSALRRKSRAGAGIFPRLDLRQLWADVADRCDRLSAAVVRVERAGNSAAHRRGRIHGLLSNSDFSLGQERVAGIRSVA